MKDFKDKVAVVTGGASGIGKAMAARFGAEGMKVVLADVQPDALAATEAEFKAKGIETLAVRCDVSKADAVQDLADRTVAAFGGVHILCNNAGVAAPGPAWERTLADWEWVVGVNLWAVIHGVRSFVPIMMKQGEGHVVNTASMAGLIVGPGMPTYFVTKHGVVALSESLHHDLTAYGSKVGVSVLCPGWVKTGIVDSARNRPEDLKNEAGTGESPGAAMMEKMVRALVESGQSPESVAERVFEAVRDRKFYILTHPEMKGAIRQRMTDVLEERNPTPQAIR